MSKWRWIILVALAAVVLRSPAFYNPIIDEDEAWYTVAAQVMNSGGDLYQDAVDLKPPLVFYFYAGAFAALGDDMRLLHGATVFWVLATAIAIGFLTARISSHQQAPHLAALLYVLFSPTFVPKALATNCEIIMNLPLVLSALFFLKARTSATKVHLLLSGAMCALAFLVKYQAGVLLGALVGHILISESLPSKAWPGRRRFSQALLIIAGFIAVLISLYVYYRQLGSWNEAYFWGWEYNFVFMRGLTLEYFLNRFLGMTPRFILIWLMLWVFAVVAIKKAFESPNEAPPGVLFSILWLAFSVAAVCVGGKFFGHYFIQLLPPLSILAAVTLADWWNSSKAAKHGGIKRVVVIAGILVPPLIYLGENWQEELQRMREENANYQMLAQRISHLTSAEERIFVWGRVPELYYFGRRLPASRFIACNFVVGMNTYNYYDAEASMPEVNDAIWDSLMQDLTEHRPRIIVDTAPANLRQFGKYPIARFRRLQDRVQEHYEAIDTLNQVVIYQRRRNLFQH